jgi:hypothetical protein
MSNLKKNKRVLGFHQKLFGCCEDLALEYSEEDCDTEKILKERQRIGEIRQNVYN